MGGNLCAKWRCRSSYAGAIASFLQPGSVSISWGLQCGAPTPRLLSHLTASDRFEKSRKSELPENLTADTQAGDGTI